MEPNFSPSSTLKYIKNNFKKNDFKTREGKAKLKALKDSYMKPFYDTIKNLPKKENNFIHFERYMRRIYDPIPINSSYIAEKWKTLNPDQKKNFIEYEGILYLEIEALEMKDNLDQENHHQENHHQENHHQENHHQESHHQENHHQESQQQENHHQENQEEKEQKIDFFSRIIYF